MPKIAIQKIGLIAKNDIAKHKTLLNKVYRQLKKHPTELLIDKNVAPLLKKTKAGLTTHQILQQADLAVVLGGDGTLLNLARFLGQKEVYVLGINLGKVGFIAEVKPREAISALKKVLTGNFAFEPRRIMDVQVFRGSKKIHHCQALNDAVINQGNYARLIDLYIKVSGKKAAHFRGDGLIISTPTGSTGHSLSAHGPIVEPDLPALIINPLCPTLLSNRALIIPDHHSLEILVEAPRRLSKHPLGLTVDGQVNFTLNPGDLVKVNKAAPTFNRIRLKNQYYRLLQEKLNWGL